MSEELRKYCRICLDVESDHVPILGDPTIYLQMKSCLSLTVSASEDLPKSVCTSCVAQLNDFYNFQLNARCSQDWLQSQLESEQEKAAKCNENKGPIQPLPDSEYNSDSLLEFLNNTSNIEEYLNNLGKEDIPSIVNILDRNQERSSAESVGKIITNGKFAKQTSKTKDAVKSMNGIAIDVLDSDVEIVKELLKKETEPKPAICLSKVQLDNFAPPVNKTKVVQNLNTHEISVNNLEMQSKSRHLQLGTQSTAIAYRCKQCNKTFRERFQMYRHAKSHVLKEEERVCDVCGQQVIGNDALDKHKQEAHGNLKHLKYRCKVCQHTSTDHREIYIHVKNHCVIQDKEHTKHLCESCGISFKTKCSLLRHISTHAEQHKCSICKKCFNDVATRDRHVLGHVDMTMCDKCGYLSSCKLETHSCSKIL